MTKTFILINVQYERIWEALSVEILQYYAIISCDTYKFFYIRANINPLKDVLKK